MRSPPEVRGIAMILDKVIEYWQKEHPQEWEAMQEEFNEYWRETSRLYTDKGGIDSAEPLAGYFIFEFNDAGDYEAEKSHRAYFHKDELLHTYYFESAGGIIADRYIDSFKDQPERIYNDVHEILEALDKSDYIKHLEEVNDDYSARHYMSRAIIRHDKDGKYIYTLEPTERNKPKRLQLFTENYTSCVSFLLAVLRVQSEVVDKYLGGDDAHFIEIIEAKAREWYPISTASAQDQHQPEARATIKRADFVEYPLDKPNSYIWNLIKEDTGGQLKFDYQIAMLPKNEALQATALYSINFEELEKLGDNLKISKKLTPFDKRVYIAVSALFNAGNEIITLTQIYYAMGYTGKPAEKQITRINEAVEKMRRSYITFDNANEAHAIPNYPRFKYNGYLLPIESITATVNGRLSDSAIKIFREPPLMTFAKQRNQVTTITIRLLQSPVNKTDSNIAIDDYLLERISKEKHKGVKSCRILYDTIYKRVGITTKNQRTRAPEKIRRYLTYYQQQGFILDYSEQPDGITVILQ